MRHMYWISKLAEIQWTAGSFSLKCTELGFEFLNFLAFSVFWTARQFHSYLSYHMLCMSSYAPYFCPAWCGCLPHRSETNLTLQVGLELSGVVVHCFEPLVVDLGKFHIMFVCASCLLSY